MDVGYLTFDAERSVDEKLDLCLKHLEGKNNFDYSFLTSLKKYQEDGMLSSGQELAIEKIYNGWNVAMLSKEDVIMEKSRNLRKKKSLVNLSPKEKEQRLNEGYDKMMGILEDSPAEQCKDEKDIKIEQLEEKIAQLEKTLSIYLSSK